MVMFRKLRKILVESFVGAIALGWMLADIVSHLINTFAAPVAAWIGRTEYRHIITAPDVPKGFLIQDALPELIRFVVLFVVWYALVRWLYYKPLRDAPSETAQNSEQPA
jgi:hypothetical protein